MDQKLKDELKAIAQAMVADNKGILAADESHGTCTRRFTALGVECSETTRQSYRQTLVTAEGLEEGVAGIILFDETLRQKTDDGTSFVDVLNRKGILPGIKVDIGSKDHALFPGESITSGLDGLRERLAEYKALGAKFAKWREVLVIDPAKGFPSVGNIYAHAHGLARYGALCQEAGIVPIIEPEVLMTGDHDLATGEAIHENIMDIMFEVLVQQNIYLEGMILKPSMATYGVDCPNPATDQEVAEATIRYLVKTVPADVPGIAFLSGGQSPEQSVDRLKMMNQIDGRPWRVTFSYGRGIQQPCLEAWAKGDIPTAQKLLVEQAVRCGQASMGK